MNSMQPSKPKKVLKKLTVFNDTRVDPYFWMNQRDHKDVLSCIEQEQKYYNTYTQPLEKLKKNIFEEVKKRIPGKDSSAPYLYKGYSYYSRYEEGKEYPIHCRKPEGSEQEQVLLDENIEAEGHKYYDICDISLLEDRNLLAFCVDTKGRRFYTVHFKDLKTGKNLDQTIEDTAGDIVWANDNKTLFYVQQDLDTLRSDQVYRYDFDTQEKTCVYEEKDETFSVSIYKTLSEQYLFIQSGATLTTELRFIESAGPLGDWKVFRERERGHKYFVADGKDSFYIITNSDDCKNYRLDVAPTDKYTKEHWKALYPHSKDTYIEDIEVFDTYVVVELRTKGLTNIMLIDRKTKKRHFPFSFEGAYRVGLGVNANYTLDTLRYNYESMTTPTQIYDYNLSTKEQTLIKTRKLGVPFNPDEYHSERVLAKARDGQEVPMSIFYRKDLFKKSTNPVYVYGYGAYGISIDPYFSSSILSLVDRGFVFAIAHIRGGAEMGKAWQEDGRLLKKKNTFYDFIDCSKFLIDKGYAHPKKLYAVGGSAGGLLMGGIMNIEPNLYNGIVAHVPFVDVITTMQDKSIPLTTGEYDEWGNPDDKTYYEYIKSYSPYDNVRDSSFPNTLVTSGYHDSQVQYWEPLKWVSKLRDHQKGEAPILLYMDMSAGHSGVTGRYQRLQLVSIEFSYLLHLEGILS